MLTPWGSLAMHGLFTARVTGNFVMIGDALAHGSAGVIAKLLALPVFCVTILVLQSIALRIAASPMRALRTMLIVRPTRPRAADAGLVASRHLRRLLQNARGARHTGAALWLHQCLRHAWARSSRRAWRRCSRRQRPDILGRLRLRMLGGVERPSMFKIPPESVFCPKGA